MYLLVTTGFVLFVLFLALTRIGSRGLSSLDQTDAVPSNSILMPVATCGTLWQCDELLSRPSQCQPDQQCDSEYRGER